MRKMLGLVLSGMLLLGMVGCSNENQQKELTEETNESEKVILSKEIEYQDEIIYTEEPHFSSANNIPCVTGRLKNNTGKKIKKMRIVTSLYDKEDNYMYTVADYISDLEAGEDWQFNLVFTSADLKTSAINVERFEINEIWYKYNN